MAKTKLLDDKEVYEILKPYAYKIVKDFAEASRNAIDKFYSDYDPIYYKRTWGMKNLFKPELKRIDGGYQITFTYSSEFFAGMHRNDNAVFEGSFVEGWHGGPAAWGGRPRKTNPKTSPSPWEMIEDFYNNYKL